MKNKTPGKKIIISKKFEGLRLDYFLSQSGTLPSRSQALKLVSQKKVFINGKTAKASALLKEGEALEIFLPKKPPPLKLVPLDWPIDVLFEDKDVIVVNKPAGLAVHPSPGHEERSLVNALFFKTRLSSGSSPLRPGVVHRLDKDVSGLLVLAKTELAQKKLIQQFKSRQIEREYWAVSLKPPSPIKGSIETWIKRHPVHRKKFISLKEFQPGGKKALSSYSLFKKHSSGLAWIKVRLQTGRTHQIRLHLSSISCPIAGDKVYGGKKLSFIKDSLLKEQIKKLGRIALHAQRLGFEHPRSAKKMRFKSPWPSDLKIFLESLNFL